MAAVCFCCHLSTKTSHQHDRHGSEKQCNFRRTTRFMTLASSNGATAIVLNYNWGGLPAREACAVDAAWVMAAGVGFLSSSITPCHIEPTLSGVSLRR